MNAPLFRILSIVTLASTWVLVSFGALVRLKGAGLACPDWPLCYGKLVPPPGFEIALEVGHRFLAVLVGLSIIALLILAYRYQSKLYQRLSWIALVIVIIQGILGGLTVIMKLWPPIVTFHLIGGMAVLAILVLFVQPPQSQQDSIFPLKPFSKKIAGAWLLLMVILTSGGANSSTYSGYACEAFPGCHSGIALYPFSEASAQSALPQELDQSFLPRFQNEWIHMIHRAIAIFGGLFLLYFAWRFLYRDADSINRMLGIGVIITVLAEIGVGIANVLYRLPVPISLLHTALAATLVLLLSYAFARSL